MSFCKVQLPADTTWSVSSLSRKEKKEKKTKKLSRVTPSLFEKTNCKALAAKKFSVMKSSRHSNPRWRVGLSYI